ncbi:MAG: AIR synthase [Thermoprotei archaeon]|nr:MAG: AIR synthase [Thermoprotei archaeon]RLF01177.1 MAG: AIR synthase [Thermoprotei archaeon]HDI74374.1 AIR synthase [Thermoprotei archaeon]
MTLALGKVPYSLLEKKVFTRLGVKDEAVILGPGIGLDSAVIDLGPRVLVIHCDPITEAKKRIGWLSVHISANDVAVCGAKPRWLLSVILLPEGSDESVLDEITADIDRAAKEIEASIVGGHTEVTPRLDRPMVITTAAGIVSKKRLVTATGAKPGDLVIATKSVGIEGTAIIAEDFEEDLRSRAIPVRIIERAKTFIEDISIVKEAIAAIHTGGVTAAHDPTEGGFIGGLVELAKASNVMIEVHEDKIPVRSETKVICEALSIDPFKLISSGSLILTVKENMFESVMSAIRREGVDAYMVGRVVEGSGVKFYRKSGSVEVYEEMIIDEITKLWEREKHDSIY